MNPVLDITFRPEFTQVLLGNVESPAASPPMPRPMN